MLAKLTHALPEGDAWCFEPKWDGFRVIVFRDGEEVLIQSRDEKPLNRYFPELIAPLQQQLPPRAVLDGEVLVARGGVLDFESLQLRIHPAASRVALLARELPAAMVFWDVLCLGDRDLRAVPFVDRRRLLEEVLRDATAPLYLTPSTADRVVAVDWFRRFEGAGLDGVMAKDPHGTYESNKRVMLKVKHDRECDCVVAGFRWHKRGSEMVGSLLLGLHDDAGNLQHVGVCASFTEQTRRDLVAVLTPYRRDALVDHPWAAWAQSSSEAMDSQPRRMPGGKSRWSGGKDLSWEPLRPELVVEVAYDHLQGSRFRHTAQFRRWRADKRPRDCTYAQLETVAPQEIADLFSA